MARLGIDYSVPPEVPPGVSPGAIFVCHNRFGDGSTCLWQCARSRVEELEGRCPRCSQHLLERDLDPDAEAFDLTTLPDPLLSEVSGSFIKDEPDGFLVCHNRRLVSRRKWGRRFDEVVPCHAAYRMEEVGALGGTCQRCGEPFLTGDLAVARGRADVARTNDVVPVRFDTPEGEAEPEEVEPLVTHQLGMVRMEDPDWLTLGSDAAEGPVLPLLDEAARRVMESGEDRIALLLGSKTADNHLIIHRIRFIDVVASNDLERERDDLVGSLRFLAHRFPAGSRDSKILGLVRIVALQSGFGRARFDPLAHNIRLSLHLGEVGYDLDALPFVVGLVLYPTERTTFFQVFAMHKISRPVPLMSLRALGPDSAQFGERYECLEGVVVDVEGLREA